MCTSATTKRAVADKSLDNLYKNVKPNIHILGDNIGDAAFKITAGNILPFVNAFGYNMVSSSQDYQRALCIYIPLIATELARYRRCIYEYIQPQS